MIAPTKVDLLHRYREVSDHELFKLLEDLDALTDVAREALLEELASRNIESGMAAPVEGTRADHTEEYWTTKPATIVLLSFTDTITLRRACTLLEQAGIIFELEDVVKNSSRLRVRAGVPGVLINLHIASADRERSTAILREQLGLFPVAEKRDEPYCDEPVSAVAYCPQRDDAEALATILDEAGILHRVSLNQQGSVDANDAFALEVLQTDLVRAGDLLSRLLERGELR